MNKIMLITLVSLVLLPIVQASCSETYISKGQYCHTIDTNGDLTVNESDTLADYNLDGLIDSYDEGVRDSFYGCTYIEGIEPTLYGINVSTTTDIPEVSNISEGYPYYFSWNSSHWNGQQCITYIGDDSGELSNILNKVSENHFVLNQTNLNINDGANVSVSDLLLEINSFYTSPWIKVNSGGNLVVTDSSIYDDSSVQFFFNFYPGSSGLIDGSSIKGASYFNNIGSPYWSTMTIASDDVTISNSEINNSNGLITYYANPTISGVNFNSYRVGIESIHSDNLVVDNTFIDSNIYSIVSRNSSIEYISGNYSLDSDVIVYSPQYPFYHFERKWKFKAQLNNTNIPQSYTYKLYDGFSNLVHSGGFDSSGLSDEMILTEFSYDYLDGLTDYNDYKIKIFRFSTLKKQQQFEIVNDTTLVITMPSGGCSGFSCPPESTSTRKLYKVSPTHL